MKPMRRHLFAGTFAGLSLVLLGTATTSPLFAEECYTFVARWGQTGDGALQHPLDVAVDSEGFAYVVDGTDGWGLIKKFKADGSTLVWERGDAWPAGLRYPHGIAIDGQGRVYVSDAHNGRIVVCSANTGDLLGWYGGCSDSSHTGSGHWHEADSAHTPRMGHGAGEFQCPFGVATDFEGAFLYVTDDQNFRVQKLSIVTPAPGACRLDLVGWFGGCDQPGQHQGKDCMHTPDTTHHSQRGPGEGFFCGPRHVAVGRNGHVYVTDGYGWHDNFAPYLHTFTTDGQFVTAWTTIPYAVYGVAVDVDGCVYLSNPIEKWLAKYTSDMMLVCSWGTYGPDPGQIDWPLGLTTDGLGRVYFTEPDTRYVQIFAPANRAPLANAGPDQTIECSCQQGGTYVTLDGSGSSDPDGDPLTYVWTGPFEGSPVNGPNPTVKLVPGCRDSYEITLVVNDGKQDSPPDTVQITVQDTTAPEISTVSASPSILWPANHKMIAVTVEVEATDTCDPSPKSRIVSVTCSEPVDGPGEEPDWQITGDLTVMLRAERAGSNEGRIYTIHVECVDASGNTALGMVDVTVPHDQREKK